MSQHCPSCNSEQFYFVQGVVEFHSMERMPDENGWVELIALEESLPMDTDQFDPYLVCENEKCMKRFNLDGTER